MALSVPFFLKNTQRKSFALLTLCGLFASSTAFGAGKLNIYCSIQNEGCAKLAQAFSQKYDVETNFVRNSTGVILGKLKLEKNNPQADIWYGGTIEPHFQAAQQGLLAQYRSPKQAEIMPQFHSLMDKWGKYTSIAYLMILGIGTNTPKLEKLQAEPPKCFTDLLNPAFKDNLQYPDPRVSGTGYTFLTTLIQLWGEEKAFDYLKKLTPNVAKFSNSGLATQQLSRGEVALDVSFMHSYEREKERGGPVQGILPCEATGYALGGVSLIQGARNLENAKLFMDWVLSPEAQEIPWRQLGAYQIPTNINAKSPPQSLDPKQLKLIDYDFDKFGSDQEAKRLIERWTKEVKLLREER